MTENVTREESSHEDLHQDAGDTNQGHAGADAAEARTEDQETAGSGEPETELEKVTRERDEYLKNWQRSQADFQNQKRRAISDLDAALRRSQASLLEEILLVLDHLDMALTTPCESADAKNLLVGVEMTRSQLISALSRQGVSPIDVSGDFDPAFHQGVATIETDEVEPGKILEVVRSGWTHKDLVLRFAQVKVAARPEGSAQEDSEASGATGEA